MVMPLANPLISAFGIAISLLVFVAIRKNRTISHPTILVFVGVLIFIQLYELILWSGVMSEVPWLLNSNTPFVFLLGPLLLAYTRHWNEIIFTKTQWFLHLLPFSFYFLYSFFFFLQPDGFKQHIIAEMTGRSIHVSDYTLVFSSDPWHLNGWVVVEILCLHLLIYGFYSLHLASKTIREKSLKTWTYLTLFSMIFAAVVLFLAEGGIVNGYQFFQQPLPDFSSDLFASISMYCLAIYILLNPVMFKKTSGTYQKSGIPDELKEEMSRKLIHKLEAEKLFLSQNFSLDFISAETGISKHHVSQIINSELGCSFFELTNTYRIREAKLILDSTEYVKMEPLAYELGYRSKSAFFKAFKKATDQTPGQYLNSRVFSERVAP